MKYIYEYHYIYTAESMGYYCELFQTNMRVEGRAWLQDLKRVIRKGVILQKIKSIWYLENTRARESIFKIRCFLIQGGYEHVE